MMVKYCIAVKWGTLFVFSMGKKRVDMRIYFVGGTICKATTHVPKNFYRVLCYVAVEDDMHTAAA